MTRPPTEFRPSLQVGTSRILLGVMRIDRPLAMKLTGRSGLAPIVLLTLGFAMAAG